MTLRYISASVVTVGVILVVYACAALQVTSVEGREEPHKYTIDELLSTYFENKDSNDLGMDPCKAADNDGLENVKFYRRETAVRKLKPPLHKPLKSIKPPSISKPDRTGQYRIPEPGREMARFIAIYFYSQI
ncbi:hypothetical protein KGM_206491 [Danaus plexippus plexippus]|uniref:Uncharacterized protein n=1 Tax=Danaus plexippus plexippus TaxID=278856 RepID=A0A212EK16_DANPL|nr:hypothetical protein KGM_206491 [Danaus plexippus plexippus]